MAELIGLIERAAALLRQQEAGEPKPPLTARANRSVGEHRHGTGARSREASELRDFHSVNARSRTVEEFRLVKRNLISAWSQSDLMSDPGTSRIIMVTSARPGEGKTFSALNLALAFASERDVKALLVDVDTQHPGLPKILGIPGDKGIVDALTGNLELAEYADPDEPPQSDDPARRAGRAARPGAAVEPADGRVAGELTQPAAGSLHHHRHPALHGEQRRRGAGASGRADRLHRGGAQHATGGDRGWAQHAQLLPADQLAPQQE